MYVCARECMTVCCVWLNTYMCIHVCILYSCGLWLMLPNDFPLQLSTKFQVANIRHRSAQSCGPKSPRAPLPFAERSVLRAICGAELFPWHGGKKDRSLQVGTHEMSGDDNISHGPRLYCWR